MLHTRLMAALQRVFPNADPATRETLAQRAGILNLRRGEVLYPEGESAQSMHLLLSGRLAIQIRGSEGRERLVAYLSEGETVGETALIAGGQRTATVIAARDSTLAKIDGETFRRAASACPAAVLDLAQTVIRRLVAGQPGSIPQVAVKHVALLPLNRGARVREFASRLQIALLRFGTTRLLTSSDVQALVGSGPTELQEWHCRRLFEDSEQKYDFIVSVADPAATYWTRHLIGHADRILFIAQAELDPTLTPIEEELGVYAPRSDLVARELVLVHFQGTPSNTASWLKNRVCDRHHHVRWMGNAGFHRLARVLSGNAITLVLSGGGARGFAHAGAVRALRETGIPIDAVGGTSFGGLIATAVALGRTHEEMLEGARRVFIEGGLLDDYTVPLVSIVRGQRMEELLRQTFGEAEILEDWVPFFTVSANLLRNSLQLHQQGPIWEALRATVSLPGIFPPLFPLATCWWTGGC
ncbi:MAG: patatin-like phospholipase domain-containing protein [Candidatus Binatia bacterium]|nr:patatin-like phospholipase domain-containing protein [Candidatus Binatia bacterium]